MARRALQKQDEHESKRKPKPNRQTLTGGGSNRRAGCIAPERSLGKPQIGYPFAQGDAGYVEKPAGVPGTRSDGRGDKVPRGSGFTPPHERNASTASKQPPPVCWGAFTIQALSHAYQRCSGKTKTFSSKRAREGGHVGAPSYPCTPLGLYLLGRMRQGESIRIRRAMAAYPC